MTIVKYHLITNCEHRDALEGAEGHGHASNNHLQVVSLGDLCVSTERPTQQSLDSNSMPWGRLKSINQQISSKEKMKILKNKGKRRQLGMDLAELFGCNRKNIQIGNTTLTKQGMITFAVHLLHKSDLDESDSTPKQYVDDLFRSLSGCVDDAFRKHFGLNDDFSVSLHWTLSMASRSPNMTPSPTPPPALEMERVASASPSITSGIWVE